MKKSFGIFVITVLVISLLIGCNRETEKITENTSSNSQSQININLEFNEYCIDSGSQYVIESNVLYGRGYNYNRILGEDSDSFYENYTKITENVIHIDACNGSLLYLTADNKVYGIGNSSDGILQSNQNAAEPTLLFEDCKFFSVGKNFVLAVKNDNSLWFWGESKHGQGTIVKDVISEPIKIADNVQFTKAFGYTSAWIDEYGSLYLCGDNSYNQIGNGSKGSSNPEKYADIVSTPFCALKNCTSFEVTDNSVIRAKTDSGDEYIWGNFHSATPNLKEAEMPQKTPSTQLASGKIRYQNNNVLEDPESLQTFYIDKDENGNESVISKRYNLDSNSEKKVVKSNIAPPFFLSSLGGGALTVSSVTDDCVYLITYNELGNGMINDINTTVLYDHYAVPIYIKDSSHLALAVPGAQKELLLNTETGESENGEIFDYSKLDNKPNIKPSDAENITLNELRKSKYNELNNTESNFNNVESVSLVLEPDFQNLLFSSRITPKFFDNINSINWCYQIKVSNSKNENNTMEILLDANSGNIYTVTNISE